MKKQLSTVTVAAFFLCSLAFAASPNAKTPTLYISAPGSFSTSLAAAMLKKHVPVMVTADQASAEYTLDATPVDKKTETTGGKIARCMFMDCVGINGNSSVSVELVRNGDKSIVWAYQVRKGMSGPLAAQSLSEAIAKHLKNDYLKKHAD